MGEVGDLRFGFGPIEQELQPEISREAGGEAGIAFWAVTAGGKGSRTPATTRTVRLSSCRQVTLSSALLLLRSLSRRCHGQGAGDRGIRAVRGGGQRK